MSAPDAPQPARAERALWLLSAAVWMASSTWFTGTAATPAIAAEWSLSPAAASWLTSATQLGFIAGTLLYSLLNLPDIHNPRRVFLVSALLGAAFNGAFGALAGDLPTAVALRFLTGITLAGVYPVGMKIVATWFDRGLGWRLGVMVGALTLGTAMPYLLRALIGTTDWRGLVLAASGLAVAGGVVVELLVGDGPYLRGKSSVQLSMLWRVFAHPPFRLTAFGYFGHMWELYAFWSFVSVWLGSALGEDTKWNVPVLAFGTIAVGAIGCVAGGWLSRRHGEARVASAALLTSGVCTILAGFVHGAAPTLLLPVLVIWGMTVVADSPMFSSLAATHAPRAYVGTALTVQNGVGFALTIGSIQLLPWLAATVGPRWAFLALTPGPVLGLLALAALGRVTRRSVTAA